jgi:hypothetical protein
LHGLRTAALRRAGEIDRSSPRESGAGPSGDQVFRNQDTGMRRLTDVAVKK